MLRFRSEVASQVRYRPPPATFSAELRWVLFAAFQCQGAELTHCVNSAEVVRLADALALASRIAGRRGTDFLGEMLGSEAAHTLARHELAARAAHHRIQAAARDISRAGQDLAIPVGFMKHGALWLMQSPHIEHRAANDLDVLVRSGDAKRLWDHLRSRGYNDCGHGQRPHHMPTLQHRRTTFVEVHWEIPGVRVDRASATLDALLALNLAEQMQSRDVEAWVPVRDVLASHLLVHGYVQHGATPDAYPAMRMLGDLIDLGTFRHPDEFVSDSKPWLAHAVSEAEIRAILCLCEQLALGLIPEPGTQARSVLDHLVLAQLDDEYSKALRVWRLTGMRGAKDWRKLARRLLAATPAELGVAPDTSPARLARKSGAHRLRMLRMLVEGAIAAVRVRQRRGETRT